MVLCTLAATPMSLNIVAQMVAEALGGIKCSNPQECTKCDRIIVVDNLEPGLRGLLKVLDPKKTVLYALAEGPIIANYNMIYDSVFGELRAVVSPSNYARKYVETALRQWISEVKIIPHGIYVPPLCPGKDIAERKDFLYRTYYFKRKFPTYGILAVREFMKKHPKAKVDIYALGAPFDKAILKQVIPSAKIAKFTNRSRLERLYYDHKFWLNLSDSEGFGMMPLEAMAHGEIVIAAAIPPFIETIPQETNILIPTYDRWNEPWAYEFIEHFVYSADDMEKAMEKAISLDEMTLRMWSKANCEWARKYNYLEVYKRFLEVL